MWSFGLASFQFEISFGFTFYIAVLVLGCCFFGSLSSSDIFGRRFIILKLPCVDRPRFVASPVELHLLSRAFFVSFPSACGFCLRRLSTNLPHPDCLTSNACLPRT